MKSITVVAGIAILTATLLFPGGLLPPVEAAQPLVLKLGHSLPSTHPYEQGAKKFAEEVFKRTNGTIRVDTFPGEQLGTGREMAEATIAGLQDFDIDAGLLIPHAPRLGIIQAFFLFKGREHLLKVLASDIGVDLKEYLIEKAGLRILSNFYFGERHITTTNKAIRSLADLKGLKIRVPEVPVAMEGLKALGANPTPMAFGELPLALKTGVVDGQENPISTIYAFKLYEVQKYIALTAHMVGVNFLVVNEKRWQGLTPEQQKILQEAADEGAALSNKILIDQENSLLDQLKQKGMTVTTPDLAPFRDAAAASWKKFEDVWGRDWIERIQKMQ
jgi:tripartite ATP-independent transporter DctP family solute receptor